MTPVFCCGFECGDNGASGAGGHWLPGGGAPAISTTTVRDGSRSLRCNASGSANYVIGIQAHTSTTRHIGRFYIQFASLPSADASISAFGLADITGPNVRFKQSDGKIYAAVGSTLGASGVSVTTGQWYQIDYDYNVNTGGTDACDVKVDGTTCGQATATGTSTADSADAIGVIANVTCDLFIDSVVWSSTAADYPIGAGYVNHFIPTSDGTHNVAGANDFERSATGTDITNATTTAFQLIDDVPLKTGVVSEYINLIAPPNATDYVEVVYGPAPGISTPTVAPRAVEAVCAYASASAGTNNLRLALNDNGTTNDIFNTNGAVGTTANYTRKHYATAPTGGAWTLSGAGNFNNIRIRCFTSDAAPDPWFASAMIEAEFAPVVTDTTFINAFMAMKFSRKRLTRSQKKRLLGLN